MSDLNSITVVGRLTADAESKQVGNSTLVTFTLANNTGFGQYACTNFFKVNAWGKQAASVLEWLKKGKQVGVTGVMENKRWTDQNGVQRDSWAITTNGTISMMADPKNASQEAPRFGSSQADYGEPGERDF